MIRISNHIEIQAEPEVVFEFLVNPEKLPEWMSTLEEMIYEGEPQVGASSEQTFSQNGKTIKVTQTITAFNPPEIFAVSLSGKDFDGNASFNLSPIPSGTLLKAEEILKPKSFFFKAFSGMVEKVTKIRQQKDLESLKNAIENPS